MTWHVFHSQACKPACPRKIGDVKPTVQSSHVCTRRGISIIYGPDRINGPEEGLVRGYKKGNGPNDIINGPDRSSTLLRGTSSE